MSVYNLLFLFLSYPKPAPAVSRQGSVIGYPETIEDTGFRLKDCRNDELGACELP